MGIVGGIVVAAWALGLLRDTGKVLLDAEMGSTIQTKIRQAIASGFPGADITDLHIWRIGRKQYACIIAVHTTAAYRPEMIRQTLMAQHELAHITVEINT